MKTIETKNEKYDVTCECCGRSYTIIAHEDDTPLICDFCYTPNLRVINREPTQLSQDGSTIELATNITGTWPGDSHCDGAVRGEAPHTCGENHSIGVNDAGWYD